MIVNRDKYLQELVSSRHNGLVKIITGMRRCGKYYRYAPLRKILSAVSSLQAFP